MVESLNGRPIQVSVRSSSLHQREVAALGSTGNVQDSGTHSTGETQRDRSPFLTIGPVADFRRQCHLVRSSFSDDHLFRVVLQVRIDLGR